MYSGSATIFALSSGAVPSGVAIVRMSGRQTRFALETICGKVPAARKAELASFRRADGDLIDRGLVLFFPGPASFTGEDVAELHLHGGRAVVAAMLERLGELPGLMPAEAGEFTRRAFLAGKLDLTAAEALADLIDAETESQRRLALANAGGAQAKLYRGWRERLLHARAMVEAELDFADEGDVPGSVAAEVWADIAALDGEASTHRARMRDGEIVRDGFKVALIGPPNAGKSSLLNRLAGREAAIVTAQAGTTRDVIETPLALDGIAMRFSDTAGLRGAGADAIETIGIDRARAAVDAADILLWLGPPKDAPDHPRCILIAAQADRWRGDAAAEADAARCDVVLSAATGEGMEALHRHIVEMARTLLPREGEAALRQRQRAALAEARNWLTIDTASREAGDLILLAERLRLAAAALDRITGRAGVEEMLDTLFGRFCIGK